LADRDEIDWIREHEPERLNELPKQEVEWYKDLEQINGIGKETAKDLGKIYSSIEELKKAVDNDSVPLRNDILIKLKTYFN